MALTTIRPMSASILSLDSVEGDLFTENHILEPEFHQKRYVEPGERISKIKGAFRVAESDLIDIDLIRGIQPDYADIEADPSSLEYDGQILPDGTQLDSGKNKRNVCALKSNCIRWGFIDFSLARSVRREFAN